MSLELPVPDADAREHSARLAAHLHDAIAAAGGAIPFERYMELALYAPGLGYYAAGARKFGAGGDFVTAPELTPLFARCVARQCAEVLDAIGGDTVLELGPGSGALAADALLELEARGAAPAQWLMLEPSPELRARQERRIAELPAALAARVVWLEELPVRPFAGVVFGNEVLDALPVAAFRIDGGRVRERTVRSLGAGFAWDERAAPASLEHAVRAIEADLGAALADGYQSELAPSLPGLVASCAGLLSRGALLFVDYGLARRERYMAERAAGTLTCHYRHRAHRDPFLWPGLQDLTAWVDFTAVADAATHAGLALAGYTTQVHFLIGCGLAELVVESGLDERARLTRSRDAQLLAAPDEMGERFKAIGFVRDLDLPLAGFAVRDLAHQL